MDSAAINSFIPTLDQVDSWSEILTLLPILIILELLLSADNAIALASLTKSLDSPLLRSKALNIGITISLLIILEITDNCEYSISLDLLIDAYGKFSLGG